MFEFGFWGTILFYFVFALYYAWPITVIFDAFFIYLVIKFIKQKKYIFALLLTPVAVLVSGFLVFIFITWMQG
ncbi:hypothetical protein ACSLVK_02045 [Photorhabdus tasmaniensis]|uniref:hypothetical protein n=1 Tax=Photorhabdus TaxID=29487 RepID=UPI0036DC6676